MAKIKSRKKRLQEYNEKYPIRIQNAEERIRRYFSEHDLNLASACEGAMERAKEILAKRSRKCVSFILYEYPMQTERPRTLNGHTFSPNAAENREYFRQALGSALDSFRLITTPAEISIDAYLEMPKRISPEEILLFEADILFPISKPDFDNVEKCYADMLTGVISADDDLFYRGTITKHYSLLPRVEIRVTYVEEHESDYVYKRIKSRKTIQEGIQSGRIVLRKMEMD